METAFLPKQKVSSAEKRKDDFQWGKDTIKAILDSADFGSMKGIVFDKLYKAYNGEIDQKDYSYVTNPYKTKDGRLLRMPARIRNYNIIKPVVDLLIGEKARRPSSYTVVNTSPDAVSAQQEAYRKTVKDYLKQLLVNIANEQGQQTGQESYDTSKIEEQIRNFNSSYKDALAIEGQNALEYLIYNLDTRDQFLTAFFDFLVTGIAITFKNVTHNDIEYFIVSPDDFDCDKSSGITYIQDGSWCARRELLTVNDILDRFYDELTEADIDELENEFSSFGSDWLMFNLTGENQDKPKRALPVYHVAFKTFVQIGFVEVSDEMGGVSLIEVDDTFKPADGQIVHWYWVNEVWEGYRIGDKKYLGIGPIAGQRSSIDNPSKCKLPYNGRVYSDRKAAPISIVSLGLPYQILYNIFHYRLELSIAKNKDKIMLMEMNTIPKRHGWDEEKFMYHADANGYAFVDSTATAGGKDVNFNQWTVLDMSLGQYISAQFELLYAIKSEWEQLVGITPQRLGNIQTSAGKATTERAVFQSAVISEELYRRFEALEQSDLQGLLDLSQIAWIDGKKAVYMNSEGKSALLNINPETYPYAELGIFAWYSAEERDKLETLRQYALGFAQNGSSPSTIAEILDAKNFSKIKTLLKEVEEKQQQYEQSKMEAEQAHAEKLEQMRIEEREDQQAFATELKEKELKNKIDLKLLELSTDKQEGTVDEIVRSNKAREALEREKLLIEREALKVKERIAHISAQKKNQSK